MAASAFYHIVPERIRLTIRYFQKKCIQKSTKLFEKSTGNQNRLAKLQREHAQIPDFSKHYVYNLFKEENLGYCTKTYYFDFHHQRQIRHQTA